MVVVFRILFSFFVFVQAIAISQATYLMEDEVKQPSHSSKKPPNDWLELKSIINKTKEINLNTDEAFQNIKLITQEIELWIGKVEEKIKLGFYTNFNSFFHELASDMKGFIPDLLKPEEVKETCGIMQTNFMKVWDSNFSKVKIPFQNYFLNDTFASDYAKAKVAYYGSRDETKAKKWQDKLSHLSPYSRPYIYHLPDKIMGIEFLHAIEDGRFRGKDSTIAVIEIEGSPSHTAGVISPLKAIPHSLGDRKGITPEANIKLYNLKLPNSSFMFSLWININEDDEVLSQYFKITKGNTLNFIINKKKEEENPAFMAYFQNGIEIQFPYIQANETTVLNLFEYLLAVKKGIILDCVYKGEADDEVADVFGNIIKSNIRIVNLSNSISLGPKTLGILKDFVMQGGLIVKAVANLGISWNKEGLSIASLSPHAVSGLKFLSDLTLYSALLKEDFKSLREGFLMVGNLSKDLKSIHNKCDKPGNSFPDLYIGAWGTDVPVFQNENERQSVLETGASIAAPMVTGTITLLHEIFPRNPPAQLGKVILSTGFKDVEGYQKDSLGEGRLDAKRAFEKIKEL